MNIANLSLGRRTLLMGAACVPFLTPAARAQAPAELEVFATHDSVLWNGVAVTPSGRVFVSLPTWLGHTMGVGEIVDGALTPFPDNQWNRFTEGSDPAKTLVSVNAVYLDPAQDLLWVIDAGTIPGGQPRPEGAAKLVAFDLTSKEAVHVFPLDQVLDGPHASPNDLRIHGTRGYLSEPGTASILTIDLQTGEAARHLTGHPLLMANPDRRVMIDGHPLMAPNGKPFGGNANQLELAPDGATLFIQPLTGGMSRIETRLLDSGEATAKDLTFWIDTPPTSGTTRAADGTIYLNAINEQAVHRIRPDGTQTVIVQDERLRWADASWIQGGYLWIPVAQLGWAPFLNGGQSRLNWPNPLLRLRLEA